MTTQSPEALAQQGIVQAEQEVAKTSARVQQGGATTAELGQARLHLAEARLLLAQVENQPQTIMEQEQAIVDERTQMLVTDTALYKAGALGQYELNTARLALAEARINLDLYTIAEIKRENAALALSLARAGIAPADATQSATQSAP